MGRRFDSPEAKKAIAISPFRVVAAQNGDAWIEIRGKEYVIGTGFRIKDVKFPFAVGGNRPKSDLNLRIDLSLRDNSTVIRKIQEQQNQVTAGQNIFSIKTSADYVVNQRLNLRIFYERVVNKPVISTSFPSANTNFGISLRFTLAN